MDTLRSTALVNPVSIFVVAIAVFLLLGGLGRLVTNFAW
jgi:hypothetical protein